MQKHLPLARKIELISKAVRPYAYPTLTLIANIAGAINATLSAPACGETGLGDDDAPIDPEVELPENYG